MEEAGGGGGGGDGEGEHGRIKGTEVESFLARVSEAGKVTFSSLPSKSVLDS